MQGLCVIHAYRFAPNAMMLFKPGRQFLLNNRIVSVNYVIVRKIGLFIQLKEVQANCRPQDLVPLDDGSPMRPRRQATTKKIGAPGGSFTESPATVCSAQ